MGKAEDKARAARDASIKASRKTNQDLSRVMAVPDHLPTEKIHETARARSRHQDRAAGRDV